MALTLQVAMKKDDELADMKKQIAHLFELLKDKVTPDPNLLDVKNSELR
jgi:hypothetical protein